MRGIPWRLLAAAALTALLLDLPFPIAGPLPAWRAVFAWFALVPLVVAVLRLPVTQAGRSIRWQLGWSLLTGWLSGALWFGANCYWVYGTMHLYAGLNAPLAVLALVLFSLYLGFWFGAFALVLAIIHRATRSNGVTWLTLVAIPFLWTAMEFALARIPEFPWDLLGYSQVDNAWLSQLAPWTGVYGISFVLAAVNALLVAGFVLSRGAGSFPANRRCTVLGVALIILGMAGTLVHPQHPATSQVAMLVQPNLDVATDDAWAGPDWDRHMAEFQRLASETCEGYLAGMPQTGAPVVANIDCTAVPPTSLIAWPESPAPFREMDPRFQTGMAALARTNHSPMIVGTVGMDDDPANRKYLVYNSASVITQEGQFIGRYDKIHLVPFGEYIPLRSAFFFLHKIVQDMPDMSTGRSRESFPLKSADGNTHRYGIFICYESVFGDEVRQFARNGAEVLVNISDDGWYGDTSAPWQHLNMARMRAIENRRWLLRDTNNGVTSSIDPYGTVRQSIPRHQVDSLAAFFAYNSALTFYTLHGDLLPGLCAILTLVLLAWSGRMLLYPKAAESSSKAA
ncbi:apolipoprotein N-acyltransferase [Acidicapsa ligni]|uniref:apolipoprotein N-acyltransferase n=1 Tax=Acidicapsa ligni TaxID=542300 RepID=UPI0021E0C590|nr:apolipoprotein N-acyltransferase [Acidicapsa ligni]